MAVATTTATASDGRPGRLAAILEGLAGDGLTGGAAACFARMPRAERAVLRPGRPGHEGTVLLTPAAWRKRTGGAVRPEPLSGEHGGGQDARICRRGGVSPGQPTGRWSQDAGARWPSPATGSRQTAELGQGPGDSGFSMGHAAAWAGVGRTRTRRSGPARRRHAPCWSGGGRMDQAMGAPEPDELPTDEVSRVFADRRHPQRHWE